MDELGTDNEYLIYTGLPYNLAAKYKTTLPSCVEAVRELVDVRTDFDAAIRGGGGLEWSYGWQQVLAAMQNGKPSMNYATGFRESRFKSCRVNNLIDAFYGSMDAVTVRDYESYSLLSDLDIKSIWTMCPAINLKERKFDGCPEGYVLVFPRYEESNSDGTERSNDPQIDELVEITKQYINDGDNIILVPMYPSDMDGNQRDIKVCREVQNKIGLMGKGKVSYIGTFGPREIKYLISKSKAVVSGGRYHAILWAIAHDVPFVATQSAISNYPKVQGLISMFVKINGDVLKMMETENVMIFKEIVKK